MALSSMMNSPMRRSGPRPHWRRLAALVHRSAGMPAGARLFSRGHMVRPATRVRAALRSRMRLLRDAREHPRRRRTTHSARPETACSSPAGSAGRTKRSPPAICLLVTSHAAGFATRGATYDVANAPEFGDGVDWRVVDPVRYSEAIFVCGPVEAARRLDYLIDQFGGSRWIGLNVTMLRPLETWNPFQLLIERDSPRIARPDLAFAADSRGGPGHRRGTRRAVWARISRARPASAGARRGERGCSTRGPRSGSASTPG